MYLARNRRLIATAAGETIQMTQAHADRNSRHSTDSDERIILSSAREFDLPVADGCKRHAPHCVLPIPVFRAESSADVLAACE